ncbi:MAG: ASKHA domain-containing protein [Candidatus Promineifilaceae bacterium]|nr:ASKHA domain-containing protein [Candidatus Promineifilaceae bacterium]
MSEHRVTFDGAAAPVTVQTGALLTEAARLAGIDIQQPCGGQGRCGRCMIRVTAGDIRRRSTLRLTKADVEKGYALACQAAVEADVAAVVPLQEKVERRLSTDRTVARIEVPPDYDFAHHQSIRRLNLTLPVPSMDDQTDDWSRLQTAIRQQLNGTATAATELNASLDLLRRLGGLLRQAEWEVQVILADAGFTTADIEPTSMRLVDVRPGQASRTTPLWGLAIDIGTTTVSVWLVDLVSGEVAVQVAEYNGQISRGEDVISRIIYASKNDHGGDEMRQLVLETINKLTERACQRAKIAPTEIVKATIAGNSTMMHLLLGVPAENIRLSPFITALNQPPLLDARTIGLVIHGDALVDCLPGVASYVGADITAGVLSSSMDDSEQVSLFLDIGTNGETVLGSSDWLVTCACSAGPAFEGAGVLHGMRATRGAIEEVWINGETYEPSFRVIGNTKPRGLCGSGLISLLAELFINGLLDKGGGFDDSLPTKRIRQGDHGLEFVVAWAEETQSERDIVITHVDVDNLLRAKAAIYAGFTVLADSVGFPLEEIQQVLIGGAFGKYINVEKAQEIGLLPDMPWDRFHFLGNTSVRGAYLGLLDRRARARIGDIAARMTYIELSADNTFYDAFTSALFLPHTDLSRFPSVVAELDKLGHMSAQMAAGGG